MQSRALCALTGAMSVLLLSSLARAQDVDVPGNLTMRSSTALTGNILKNGDLFLHNFGIQNTFLGIAAGNSTMSGAGNTATGFIALANNSTGFFNTANGVAALSLNTTGEGNTASGWSVLEVNTTGSFNTASGVEALFHNTGGSNNTASGVQTLVNNLTGSNNTAYGSGALGTNRTGDSNTATGLSALSRNTTGSHNTAIGDQADVSVGGLINATAIGAGAFVNASNKVRLGNDSVTVIEGLVGFSANSDRNRVENLQPVRGEEVLTKIRRLSLTSWNFIGQDATQFRHYGPMAEDFFAAFGHDAIGTIGTETTITSTDLDGILMVAAQALERRTRELVEETAALRSENAGLKARLEALERRISTYALTKAE